MRGVSFFVLTSLMSLPAVAQETASPQQTVQQRFDAAKALLDKAEPAKALPLFEALERDLVLANQPAALNLTLSRMFKGAALSDLQRFEEARKVLELVVDGGVLDQPKTSTLHDDALLRLASLRSVQLDDAGAAQLFEILTSRAPAPRDKMIYTLSRAGSFALLDPERSLKFTDEALAFGENDKATTKRDLAAIQNTRGRALLNAGRIKEARASFQKAIVLSGGLDLKIDYSEYSSRSDAAIAALRAGDKEAARRLLAFTGSGRTKTAFGRGVDMTPPQCGGLDGLAPEDFAIIELALGKDGHVIGVRPVFANRPGPMAYVFARAVSDWRWDPDSIAKLDPFYLNKLRVEVRCSKTLTRPTLFNDSTTVFRWLKSKGIVQSDSKEAAPDLKQLMATLATAQTSGDQVRIAVAQLDIGTFYGSNEKQVAAALEASGAAFRAAGAPLDVWLSPTVTGRIERDARLGRASSAARSATQIEPLRADTAIAADSKMRNALNLVLADLYASARLNDKEAEALNRVVADATLVAQDPLRIAALLALANLSATAGDTRAAEQAYQQTGLDARQCAALDAKPVLLKSNVSGSDFPLEALRWGFEGWTRAEYDIDASGKTTGVRAIIAYPPLVFVDAAVGMAQNFQYRPSFRPEGGLGCSARNENITFAIPK